MRDLDADISPIVGRRDTGIINRTRGRCVNSSNKWGKNWRTHE